MIRLPVAASRRGPRSLEPGAASRAFALLPDELSRLELGTRGATLFGELQRPWRWGEAGPSLSRVARGGLAELGLSLPELVSRRVSADGSTKLALAFGDELVEAVHMPRGQRVTLCVSSQVGCAMGCTFCATAAMGFRRQLAAGEIVAQVLGVTRALGPRHPGQLTLVFMGMGEPLHNLPEVARAVEVLCAPLGLGLSARRITLSTSGLVPEIDALGGLTPRPLLALSLNATTDEVRRELMPIARRYSLAELRAALERFPLRPRERITIEYVLLSGINDTPDDARRLADFCAGFPHQLNLIPFNEHPLATFRAPSEARLSDFARAVLARRPSLITVRRSRGRDVQGACGQLVQS